MLYTSTRNADIKVTASEAIIQGLSEDGGLFVPEKLPEITTAEIESLGKMQYHERAFTILQKFLGDFSDTEIQSAVKSAYGRNFSVPDVTQIKKLSADCFVLELFHGPTCAFKDMALQLLPYLMLISAEKCTSVQGKRIAILTATSGDTGKAALEGFKDVPGTSVTVFYPEDGVSEMQKRQMTTQQGANVRVCAVKGNFDDCQNGVKEIFTSGRTDGELAAELQKKNMVFSSANSINWGRLAPQIVYYISAYASLLESGEIKTGEKVNICVPTGNFGNILAAYYAKQMGLPVNKLICASNSNNVLTDFIKTGVYDRQREFYTTVSPSMDILISSNLERLIYQYHLSPNPDEKCNSLQEWFAALKTQGRYEVNERVKAKIERDFYGGWCNESDTAATIKAVFEKHAYLIDPHTAVAFKIYDEYKAASNDDCKTIIVSTANPYKFCGAVYRSLGKEPEQDEFMTAQKLEWLTNTRMPDPLFRTQGLPVRFSDSVEKGEMKKAVIEIIRSL
ncbi:MAG: threonine synthase [Oscillospiraceae bacterium]|nr:threonine synthase [Oscillospiraceae bacterium]